MKRLITLIVLLGLSAGLLLTGCNSGDSGGGGGGAMTNAPAPGTNAPAK